MTSPLQKPPINLDSQLLTAFNDAARQVNELGFQLYGGAITDALRYMTANLEPFRTDLPGAWPSYLVRQQIERPSLELEGETSWMHSQMRLNVVHTLITRGLMEVLPVRSLIYERTDDYWRIPT